MSLLPSITVMYFIKELKVHRHCKQVRERGVQYPSEIHCVCFPENALQI